MDIQAALERNKQLATIALPQAWILTFDRPVALNRLVSKLNTQGFKIGILSNHPRLGFTENNIEIAKKSDIIINSLNSAESNSWCARSWNTLIMKAFDGGAQDAIFIQDDTDIADNFADWIQESRKRFDFIWGPAGDQFFYTKFDIIKKTGWWDERYIGCYCGDAEYLKRVYITLEKEGRLDWLSVEDSHNWGFNWNPCGISKHVITTYEAKTIDPNYNNQHWQFENICSDNPTIRASQAHFLWKWGVLLDSGQPVINDLNRQQKEIDWYPWFSKKHGFIT